MSWTEFFEYILEDIQYHGGGSFYQKIKVFFLDDRFQLLFNYRLSRFMQSCKIPLVPMLVQIVLKYVNMMVFSSIISPYAKLGKRCKFQHPIGIVIGRAVIGDDVKIFQQVTIGSKGTEGEEMAYPTIGNSVTIYAQSMLLGSIIIEDNVTIAANSVVIENIDRDSVYAGSPAKKIK